jgi:hypothetical protein
MVGPAAFASVHPAARIRMTYYNEPAVAVL